MGDEPKSRGVRFTGLAPTILLLGALMVLGLALRSPGFATRQIWYDEAEQYYISSSRTVFEVLPRLIIADRNPPGYALVVWGSLRFGDSEFWLRLPSLLAGIATVAAAYVVGKCWSSRRVGFVMATLAAVLPPWVFYAREARPYAGGLLLNLLFLHAVGMQFRCPSRKVLAYLSLTALSAILWQYVSLFVVGSGLLAGLIFAERQRRRDWLIVMSTVLVLALVQMAAVQYPQIRNQGIRSAFLNESYYSWNRPLVALKFWAAKPAELLEYLTLTFNASVGVRILSLVAWLPIGLGAIVAWRRDRALVVATLLPIVAVMILAGLRLHPFGGIRHCLPLAPGVLLLYGSGLDCLRKRVPSAAFLSFLVILAVCIRGDWAEIPRWHKYDTMEMVARVESQFQPGDSAMFSTLAGSVQRYYSRECWNKFAEVVYCDGGTDPAGPDEIRLRNRPSPQQIELGLVRALRRSSRLWLISADDNMQGVEKMIAKHAHKTTEMKGRLSRASLWIPNVEEHAQFPGNSQSVSR